MYAVLTLPKPVIAAGVGIVISRVCVYICPSAVKGKQLELSTLTSTDIWFVAVARHALSVSAFSALLLVSAETKIPAFGRPLSATSVHVEMS